jgi:hypothetical protein
MARILIAWEFGENLGHVGQFLPLAKALRAAGHSVWFALKKNEPAHRVVAERFTCLEAPAVWSNPPEPVTIAGLPPEPVQSYADLLRTAGWCDPKALARALRAWSDLFECAQPDVLLCHAAPTAQLAAFGQPMRVVRLGTGFECPPLGNPFGPMRYWEPMDERGLARREQQLLVGVQEALGAAHKAGSGVRIEQAESLAELLTPNLDLLCTLPELDHYPRRQALESRIGKRRLSGTAGGELGERIKSRLEGGEGQGEYRDDAPAEPESSVLYYGPLLTQDQGINPAWPDRGTANLFAYLRPPFAAALDVLKALRRGPWNTLLVMPGLPEAQARALASPYLNVAITPVRMDMVLQDCTAVITYGGHGTVAGSLLAGKPVLNLPRNTEQLLVSRNAARAGAGMIASAEIQGQDMTEAIARLVENPDLSVAAKAIARRNAGLDVSGACGRLVQVIGHLLD